MVRIKQFLLIVFLAAIYFNSSAQNTQVMYYMKIPQNHLINPAVKPDNLYYLGVPVLSGISTSINNNFLELTDIFTPDLKADSIISFQNPNFNLNQIADKLKKHNNISVDANIQFLGFGFTVWKDLYIFVDVIDRVEAAAVFPKDLLNLYLKNYDQFLNQTVDLSGLNFNGQYFREYGLGFSKNLTDKLRVGAKIKLLSGIASASLDDRKLALKINSDNFTKEVTADATLNISGKKNIDRLFYDNYILKRSSDTVNRSANVKGFMNDLFFPPLTNTGLGFDFGAVYEVNRMITVSASVTDLGFIKWKDDLTSYSAKDTTLTFNRFTLQDVVDQKITLSTLFDEAGNTIRDSFKENATSSAFKTYLATEINLGANINLLPVFSVGILSSSKIWSGEVKEALTLSGNVYLGRMFSGSLSYTTANYSFDNLGIGLAFKAGPAQIYLIADKIPVKWSRIYLKKQPGEFTPLSLPDRWYTLNFQFGLNIAFGKVVNTQVDKPMLSRQND